MKGGSYRAGNGSAEIKTMAWEKELRELNKRKELAREMGGKEAVAKQHSLGKLTVRERIDLLFDKGTFHEIGSIAGKAVFENGEMKSYLPDDSVNGWGNINGRPVGVNGADWTIRGTSGGAGGKKWFFMEKMSLDWRMPFIRLLDAGGTRVGNLESMGYPMIPDNPTLATQVQLMAQVPVVSAVLGIAGGWVAIVAASSHWSIMTKKTSQVFVAGPPVVKRALSLDVSKDELGGHKIHAYQSGVIDNLAEDEEDAFRQIKAFLSYLPQNVWHQPPRMETGDPPNRRDQKLLSIIPENRKKIYDMRKLIGHIVDKGSIFELSPFYGRSIITALARIHGYPVAVMANDPGFFGGAVTGAGCEKMERFIDLADTFHLPIIYLVDVPGFMIGPDSEREGTLRKATRAIFAMEQASTPWIGVLVGRCFGVAGWMHRSSTRISFRYAWTTAKWGSLPIEGGALAAYKQEIETAADPEKKLVELENRLARLTSPFRTAEEFGIEEIIDPRESRPLLCDFIRMAQEITATQLGPKHSIGMRP
jgi:acetyl-CoA carboxylase carboxyltransferase component